MSLLLPNLHILGALDWDPTVRGALIFITAVAILPGSVYLLLATNVGARLGFLLALTGLFGWLTLQGVVWTVYAQGNKGRQPSWDVKEVVTGDLATGATTDEVDDLDDWEVLEEGNKVLGDASATADHVLLPATGTTDAHGNPLAPPEFPPVYEHPNTDEGEGAHYVRVGAYRTGGETYPKIPGFPDSWDFLSVLHKPHFAVLQYQATTEESRQPKADGSPGDLEPDEDSEVVSVIMERDLGSVRQPPFMLFVSSAIIFGILVSTLHRRDKEIMAARAAVAAA